VEKRCPSVETVNLLTDRLCNSYQIDFIIYIALLASSSASSMYRNTPRCLLLVSGIFYPNQRFFQRQEGITYISQLLQSPNFSLFSSVRRISSICTYRSLEFCLFIFSRGFLFIAVFITHFPYVNSAMHRYHYTAQKKLSSQIHETFERVLLGSTDKIYEEVSRRKNRGYPT
jgi:hypothetical protein